MRPLRDAYFLQMATLVATRATCARRAVGCVLVNARGHVLATGYNGVASGFPHCNENLKHECLGANSKSGEDLDNCQAVHAEQNALLQCKDVFEIETVYVTTEPCPTCTKLLLNTGARRIVVITPYSNSGHFLWCSRRDPKTWEVVSEC